MFAAVYPAKIDVVIATEMAGAVTVIVNGVPLEPNLRQTGDSGKCRRQFRPSAKRFPDSFGAGHQDDPDEQKCCSHPSNHFCNISVASRAWSVL